MMMVLWLGPTPYSIHFVRECWMSWSPSLLSSLLLLVCALRALKTFREASNKCQQATIGRQRSTLLIIKCAHKLR